MRRLSALAALVLVAGVGSDCSSSGGWPGPDLSGAAAVTAARPPSPFSSLGLRHAFRLPPSWTGNDVAVSGDTAVLTAQPTPPVQTTQGGGIDNPWPYYVWAVDTRTGRGWRSRQVNLNWWVNDATSAGGWVVHVETRTGHTGPWRLYAQREHASPVLLAQSAQDGFDFPRLSSDGTTVAWEQLDGAGRPVIEQWRPGDHRPRAIARPTPSADEGSGRIANGVVTWSEADRTSTTVYAERNGHRQLIATLPSGIRPPTVGAGDAIVYFHEGCWRVHRPGSGTEAPCVGPAGLGEPYNAEWVSPHAFIGWTSAGFQLISTEPGAKSVAIGDGRIPGATYLSIPGGTTPGIAEDVGAVTYVGW